MWRVAHHTSLRLILALTVSFWWSVLMNQIRNSVYVIATIMRAYSWYSRIYPHGNLSNLASCTIVISISHISTTIAVARNMPNSVSDSSVESLRKTALFSSLGLTYTTVLQYTFCTCVGLILLGLVIANLSSTDGLGSRIWSYSTIYSCLDIAELFS